jgi:hypothetical protein
MEVSVQTPQPEKAATTPTASQLGVSSKPTPNLNL